MDEISIQVMYMNRLVPDMDSVIPYSDPVSLPLGAWEPEEVQQEAGPDVICAWRHGMADDA